MDGVSVRYGSTAAGPSCPRAIVKADHTDFYFDVYPEEKTTVAEEFFVTQAGVFTAPVTSIESLYAPHYRANDGFSAALRAQR